MLAHIAGIPLEEAVLSLAPIALASSGIAGLRLRQRLRRSRSPEAHGRLRLSRSCERR